MPTALPRHIIDFANPDLAPVQSVVDDPALVDAPYHASSWRHYVQPGRQAMAGIWEAGPHLERCSCDFDELCHLLEGRVRLTDREGVSREFAAGDSFVVAAGFEGTWENLTVVRKVFFIVR
ncbi:cupin domain-containing protein [Pseudomonas entomophila]|uniref:cupin domain-containing protein n=1 Tax=Pseudomonas entomophila TaxID=312306 RepID=UPI0023D821B7|nr:cupin domain-containing protein [Pseudomonas entomophila]MDF0731457.1 cupin domain-containing protein [Pseudomonas entomophila]